MCFTYLIERLQEPYTLYKYKMCKYIMFLIWTSIVIISCSWLDRFHTAVMHIYKQDDPHCGNRTTDAGGVFTYNEQIVIPLGRSYCSVIERKPCWSPPNRAWNVFPRKWSSLGNSAGLGGCRSSLPQFSLWVRHGNIRGCVADAAVCDDLCMRGQVACNIKVNSPVDIAWLVHAFHGNY